MTRLIAVALCAALTGCGGKRVVIEYVPVEVVREVYVPIPAELVAPHPIAEGPLAHCPVVAAARRAELEKCNADKAAIRQVSPKAD